MLAQQKEIIHCALCTVDRNILKSNGLVKIALSPVHFHCVDNMEPKIPQAVIGEVFRSFIYVNISIQQC